MKKFLIKLIAVNTRQFRGGLVNEAIVYVTERISMKRKNKKLRSRQDLVGTK